MKIKEVCALTGLTKKTIRFYEERGLITPKSERKNGRSYREYAMEDVEILREVAILRKAMFTIEEIQAMQQYPDNISTILADYGQRVDAMEHIVGKLSRTMKEMDITTVHSMSNLATQISDAVEDMPLPKIDRQPHFKHLDETEELPPHVTQQVNFDEMVPDKRVFTQMTASALGYKSLNQLNQYYATQEALHDSYETKPSRIKKEPLPMRILKGVLTAATALTLIFFLFLAYDESFYWDIIFESPFNRRVFVIFLAMLVLRFAITGVQMWIAHRKWLRTCRK